MNRRGLAWILIGFGILLGAATVTSTALEFAGFVGDAPLEARGAVDAVSLAIPGVAFFAVARCSHYVALRTRWAGSA